MNNAGRIGFLIKGDYSSTATYDFLDVVFYNGASYVAKKLTTGNAPVRKNEYWQIFAEGGGLAENSDISETIVTFDQAENRVNVASGDKFSVFAGKVKKFFADLKTVAFTGKYSDLTGQPGSLKNPNALTFTGGVTGSYDGSAAKSVAIPTVPASLKNPNALTFTGGATGSYDGSAAKSVAIPSGTNSLLATAAGTWLDAVQGKNLKDLHDQNAEAISQLNGRIGTTKISSVSRLTIGEEYSLNVGMTANLLIGDGIGYMIYTHNAGMNVARIYLLNEKLEEPRFTFVNVNTIKFKAVVGFTNLNIITFAER